MLHAIERSIHFKHSLKDGISAIYLNTVLRRFSLSLFGLFLPVYIFTKSREYWIDDITHGIYGLILYLFVWLVFRLLTLLPVAKLITRVGYRWTITASNLLWILLLIVFFVSNYDIKYLLIAPLIHSAATNLYWLSYHSMFAEDGHVKHLGHEVGLTQLIGSAVSIVGPLAGGLIIDNWGFPVLFLLSLFVMAFSGIPFFWLPRHKPKDTISLKDVFNWFKERRHSNEVVSMFGRSLEEEVSSTWWPIYMFIIVGTYSTQGLVASLSLLFGSFAVYYAGKYMDRTGNKKRLLFGSVGTGLLWLIRGLVNSFRSLLFIDILMQIVSPFYWVNYESLLYKDVQTRSENNLLFMTARMVTTSFSYLIVLVVAFIFAGTELRFIGLLALASIGSILSYFIWESEKLNKSK